MRRTEQKQTLQKAQVHRTTIQGKMFASKKGQTVNKHVRAGAYIQNEYDNENKCLNAILFNIQNKCNWFSNNSANDPDLFYKSISRVVSAINAVNRHFVLIFFPHFHVSSGSV